MPSILIVDDEPKIVRLVSDYLADAGFGVSAARTGDEALMRVRPRRRTSWSSISGCPASTASM